MKKKVQKHGLFAMSGSEADLLTPTEHPPINPLRTRNVRDRLEISAKTGTWRLMGKVACF